ncbi:hypothetical protein LSH36_726g00017 [Paralvinella palmiformis]|uniref:F5/8 type C domain-containing protein n=1 Tax=Paralvinella palmiformis TaxID=53620 RepID=A0AAD9J1Z3_9ANNE|nr:hypothetical protein LSH36_726g00017 [Paralvinella palmiformis]
MCNNCGVIGFFAWPGIHRDGIITQVISHNVYISTCERVCNLYNDCIGFNVNWTNATLEVEQCIFLTIAPSYHWNTVGIGHPQLAFYEKGYKPKNAALPITETTCVASAESKATRRCENVMDGDLEVPWTTNIVNGAQWIQLNFSTVYEIRRIDIYHRCRYGTQCSMLDLTFDGEEIVHISRTCTYYKHSKCTHLEPELYYVDMIPSSSARISCTKRCIAGNYWIGFNEILVWV